VPWFKVDDGFHGHPKVVELSTSAVGVWTLCGSWCAKYLTDGAVNLKTIVRLGGAESDALELVQSGLWLETGDGFQFKDWDKYQPLKATVEAEREAAQERMRSVRAKRKGTRSGEVQPNVQPNDGRTFGDGSEEVRLAPSHPIPVPSQSPDKSKRGTRLPSDWKPSTELAAWAIAKRPDLNVSEQLEAFRDYWKSTPGSQGVKLDWDATWRSWIRNAYASKVPDTSKPTVSGVVTPVECSRHPYYPAYDCARCAEELAVAS
jgi:hypothetical protein